MTCCQRTMRGDRLLPAQINGREKLGEPITRAQRCRCLGESSGHLGAASSVFTNRQGQNQFVVRATRGVDDTAIHLGVALCSGQLPEPRPIDARETKIRISAEGGREVTRCAFGRVILEVPDAELELAYRWLIGCLEL